ncbi:hypothetical protein V1524DRAFT_466184 [Lipomyces starkeyi]
MNSPPVASLPSLERCRDSESIFSCSSLSPTPGPTTCAHIKAPKGEVTPVGRSENKIDGRRVQTGSGVEDANCVNREEWYRARYPYYDLMISLLGERNLVLRDGMRSLDSPLDLSIFGTDTARPGVPTPESGSSDMPSEILQRHSCSCSGCFNSGCYSAPTAAVAAKSTSGKQTPRASSLVDLLTLTMEQDREEKRSCLRLIIGILVSNSVTIDSGPFVNILLGSVDNTRLSWTRAKL